ncbi:MAG: sulfatase-like hydrolase/transferase, partial [Nitrospira sp.]|nr:sulfatase-like hydrolase/transferase [Nitrospira sp.]
HKNPTNFVRNGKALGPCEGYSALLVVDEAIAWLRHGRDRNKPFFLAVWTHEPHLPIETDPEFQQIYRDCDDPELRQHHGNISQLDHAFGRLIKELEDQKLTASTFVFFTSDNGPEGPAKLKGRTRGSTGGLRGRKRSMYEGGIRVPGIVRWPAGIPAGRTLDVPIIGSDFFPTALHLAGVPIPDDRVIDGGNVLPLLTGRSESVVRPRPLFWRLDMAPPAENLHLALRQGNWKLLASRDFKYFELYDLAADPRETTDRKHMDPERFRSMRRDLEALNAEIEKEGPDWWRYLSPNGGAPLKK